MFREQSERHLNPRSIFPKKPTIHLEPEELVCHCAAHCKLKMMKTKEREVRTMHIGPFYVHETVKYCPINTCKKTYRCAELDNFLPPGSNFGYDVIEYIGYAVWRKSHTALQIRTDLKLKCNITISESEVYCLAKKFVYYMVEAQKDKLTELKSFLHKGGGYFLYFDSMHPGDGAAHIMCAVAEEISEKVNIVLGSTKLPTESTESVAAFFKEIKETYGNPLAGICDMLASNLAAFKQVFPGVLLLICHFHFLRAVGKDFLEYEIIKLQHILKQYKVNQRLKELLKNCKEKIDANPTLSNYLKYNEAGYRSSFQQFPGVVKTYCKIQWILAYEQELNGYGAPFDRSEFVYLERMRKTYESLKEHSFDVKELSELKFFLASVLEDPDLKKHIKAIEKKIEDFDNLRSIMKIAPTFGGKGLNDDGEECDMTLMEELIKNFIYSDAIKNNPDDAYKKLRNQFSKYWKMLFAKPVEAHLPNGEIVQVYPQRTTNLMERLFREFQRCEYKRTGMGTLGRTARAMVAETPMMKNLDCPEFMNIILNGQPTLAARFAQLDLKSIQENMAKAENKEKLPKGLKKIINDSDFHKVFTRAARLMKKAA
jgi:hypothetical protein